MFASSKPLKTTKDVNFENPNGFLCTVPEESYANGATILWLFYLIVGDNYDSLYFPAAIIHNCFCYTKTYTALDTHRNCYHVMLATTCHSGKYDSCILQFGSMITTERCSSSR